MSDGRPRHREHHGRRSRRFIDIPVRRAGSEAGSHLSTPRNRDPEFFSRPHRGADRGFHSRRTRQDDLDDMDSDDGAYDSLEVGPASARFYTTVASNFITLATFAGGITLATQLLIQCPHSRLQTLLALSSQLFLASPLVLFTIFLALRGRPEDYDIGPNRLYRAFILAQFLVATFMLVVAFLLLGCSIYVADVTETRPGGGV